MIVALITIFFTSVVISLSGAMMPGPLLTVTISESAGRGALVGPLLITGHALLELMLIVALLLGLGPILKHDLFFLVVALAGGLIMFWMAWNMFRSLPVLSVKAGKSEKKSSNLLLTGALMSLANPYWIIWWATIGIGYIVYAQNYGMWGIAFFFTGHIAGDYLWYSAISIAISKGQKLFTDRVYRTLIAICGTFLVGFALYLVVSAFLRMYSQ